MCREIRPLPDTHPEFTVVRWQGFTEYRVAHFRLARDGSGCIIRQTCTWSWVDVGALVLLAFLVREWFQAREGGYGGDPAFARMPLHVLVLVVGASSTFLLWTRFTQVLHESLLVFPTLGIQLETHRGHPLLPPLHTTCHFIPLSALEDVIVHEGFRRWNVRYYLAAIQRRGRPLAAALARAAAQAEAEAEVGNGDADGDGDGDRARLHEAENFSENRGASPGVVEVHVAFENVLPYFPVLKAVYLGVQETLFPSPAGVVDTHE